MLKLIESKERIQTAVFQYPIDINGDNLSNIRRQASTRFSNKKRDYLEDKINNLATNSRKNIRDQHRGINEFRRDYHHCMKDKNSDLLTDSHNILNWWKTYFPQLMNVKNISDVRQIEIHTAEPLVPGPSDLEVEIAIAKLKSINHQAVTKFPQN
jgi:hypothetical protein